MNKKIFLIALVLFQLGKVRANNYAPVAIIENPKTGSNFKIGEKITFKGKATDLEDGELSGKSLIWISDVDGHIGESNSFSAVLSESSHIIILTATDSENSLNRASIFITVGVLSKPIGEIEKPKEEKLKEEKLKPEKQTMPSFEFLFVPPFGSFENLQGRLLNADPNEFAIAVYIMVDGLWWSKPTIKINKDGKWTCDITTAENDELAIKIAAYLIPVDYQPPLASGEFWILKEIENKCLAKIEVLRKIRGAETVLKLKEIQKAPPNLDLNILSDRFVPDSCWLAGFCRVDNLLANPIINDWFRKSIHDIADLNEEIRQKIYDMQILLIFSTISGSSGIIGVFDSPNAEELLKNFEGNVKQIDEYTLLFFWPKKGESLESILDKPYQSNQPVAVRDALKAADQADIGLAIDCERIRRLPPEIWKEIIGDSNPKEVRRIFNDLKLVAFQVQINQKFNLGIDMVCENNQSVQILSQELQMIRQQMISLTKEKSFPNISFQTEGMRLIVTLEYELEEVIRILEN